MVERDLDERFGIRLPAADAPVLADVVSRLVQVLEPRAIYLFGSRARGDWTEESDYDIFVLVGYPVDRPYRLEQQAYRAIRALRLPVDVVVMSRQRFDRLRTAAASLPATIEREGRILYAA